jgi:hypothetical protein
MTRIDIPVSDLVQSALDLPSCADLGIPAPSPLKVTLPTGGSLQALADVSKGIPTDCAMSLNLMLQISPLLAALECPLKMLKVIGPLVEAVTGLADVPPSFPSPQLIGKLVAAVADLAPCLAVVVPGGPMVPFVKDLLCLIRTILRCLLSQLRGVRDLLTGLQLSFDAAHGNADLLAQLECAQANAAAATANVTQAIEPISAVLALMSPLFELAQMPPITLSLPGGTPAGAEGLSAVVDTLQGVVDVIDDATGGICG